MKRDVILGKIKNEYDRAVNTTRIPTGKCQVLFQGEHFFLKRGAVPRWNGIKAGADLSAPCTRTRMIEI
jgi:hypothetical protein